MGAMPVRVCATHRGVGLVEVLVAIAVFSVGVLGTFAMQISAARVNFDAAQQLMATGLVRDILERMRANAGELDAYAVNGVGQQALPFATDCRLASCSAADLAAFDLFAWTSRLSGETESVTLDEQVMNSGGLVSPRACIQYSQGKVEVTIAWKGFGTIGADSVSNCGANLGLYGSADELRRLLVITTYIGSL
jgi:type IV pilus assembly protein PilV